MNALRKSEDISRESSLEKHRTDVPDEASSNDSRDIEKGERDAQKPNEVMRQTEPDENLVGWDGPNDPENPMNWDRSKKYITTVAYSGVTFCLTFASSVFSTATTATSELFGVSMEVMTLGTSLFVLACDP